MVIKKMAEDGERGWGANICEMFQSNDFFSTVADVVYVFNYF